METTKLNLEKGQTVNLNQEAGKVINKVNIGLGWDFNSNSRIDLDASAIVFDNSDQHIGQCYFNEKDYNNGAIKSSGDNLTGEGDGDDETLTFDFSKLPETVKKIFVTITNYTEQPLSVVKNAFARAVDPETGNELVRFELNQFGANTALLMLELEKTAGGFTLKALGEAANGKTLADLIPTAKTHL